MPRHQPPRDAGEDGEEDVPGEADGEEAQDRSRVIPPPEILVQKGEQDEQGDEQESQEQSFLAQQTTFLTRSDSPQAAAFLATPALYDDPWRHVLRNAGWASRI